MSARAPLLPAIVKSLRPVQWLKNAVMFAPLIFSGLLFSTDPITQLPYFVTTLYAAFIFCILASSIYLLNDIIDIKADRAHPFKKNRPVASGALSVPLAFFLCLTGVVLVFVLSWPLGFFFKFLCMLYLIMQIGYSLYFKHIPLFDVLFIATAFVIRVYAGATVGYIHLNSWFLLTVISASLFIAVCKRQSELTLVTGQLRGVTRQTLRRYNQRLLDAYSSMFATATWLTYALFTFQYQFVRPEQNLSILYPNLPRILRPEKLLMATIPVAIVGVMRYLQLMYEKNEGEAPAKIFVTDKVLLPIAIVFVVMIVVIVYVPTALNDWLD
ncbi:UbiA prenyltransferase family protein [bacterium]|nr:UbiA prenyltransferase family protein [bacterium]